MALDLIDCHLHLFFPDELTYAWTRGKDTYRFPLDWPFFDKLPGREEIKWSIFMEVDPDESCYRRESELVAELIRDPSTPLIGQISCCRPHHPGAIEPQLERADELSVVGYRQIIPHTVNEMKDNATFIETLKKIGAAGRNFDLCLMGKDLPAAAEIVAKVPDTLFVLDHVGNPDVAGGPDMVAEWERGLKEVAALPNVACKMSGILANCAPGDISAEVVLPYVRTMIETFGTDRVVWGSDWPVVNTKASLEHWVGLSKTLLAEFSPSERDAIARDNAIRIYRLAPLIPN